MLKVPVFLPVFASKGTIQSIKAAVNLPSVKVWALCNPNPTFIFIIPAIKYVELESLSLGLSKPLTLTNPEHER